MDGGASQFTGGGFMASQADVGGDGLKKSSTGQQTLRAVTIRQLCMALDQATDDQLYIDGEELTSVTIVGRIVTASEAATCLSFKVDDGTGVADVRYWVDREDSELLQQNKAQWCQDAYVRIHGNIRTFGHDRQVVAFQIRAVTDFNEVTYHFLQCIFQHEHITRGGNSGQMRSPLPVKAEAGASKTPQPWSSSAAPSNPNEIGNDGLNHGQRLLKELFESPECVESESGFSVKDAVRRLGNQLSEKQVKEAIGFLVQECHIYTTIDDDHYKSTIA